MITMFSVSQALSLFLAATGCHRLISFNGKGIHSSNFWQFASPICLRSKEAFPYRIKVPRGFQLQIRSWDPPQWHLQDRPPDKNRNKCISSYRCRNGWSDERHLRGFLPR